ncbi:MAG: thioredoxin family protein [Sphingobacteriaceae bacterium]
MSFIYDESLIASALNYKTYRQLIDKLLLANKTTGENQEADMVNYTRLNVQRMRRLDKTVTLKPALNAALASLNSHYTFLVLTEAWCGDASQIIPVFNHIAEASQGKISLSLLLRDENLNLMDQHLFNGTRSIPRLIVLNEWLQEVASWGPRPEVLQGLLNEWRSDAQMTHEIWAEKAHAWYAADRTAETQKELTELISGL